MDPLPTLEDRKIMTIVMITYFKESISSIESIFYALPAVETEQSKPKRKVRKIKFEHPGASGVVISARYQDKVRGIIRAISKKKWRHSVVVDMSEEVKNISFKVSPTNLHMCGCKTIPMGIEASKIMIDHINSAQENVKLIQSDIHLSTCIFKEILRECTYQEGEHLRFDITKMCVDVDDGPEGAKRWLIRKAYINFFSDVVYRDHAVLKFKWLLNVQPFISGPLEYSHFKTGMMKYRFNLNFQCNLYKMLQFFPLVDTRFFMNYYSGVRNKVVFEFPCFTKPESKHTFSVERSGQVTHSCSILSEIDDVFNLFVGVIGQIREYITDDPNAENEDPFATSEPLQGNPEEDLEDEDNFSSDSDSE